MTVPDGMLDCVAKRVNFSVCEDIPKGWMDEIEVGDEAEEGVERSGKVECQR